jgi:hypothetical protein
MTLEHYHMAFALDARSALVVFESMRTEELLHLQWAHEADQAQATSPEAIMFCGGRLALIANVLGKRGIRRDHATVPSITCPTCRRTSYQTRDIAEKYCGFCHRFHDDPAPEVPS